MSIFVGGNTLAVIARGPGTLRLLSWQSNGGIPAHVGGLSTTNAGLTKFVVGFSHTFERFALIWEGEGEAVYQIGTKLGRKPVGRTWDQASVVHWGSSELVTEGVLALVANAVVRNGSTTLFVVPDTLS